MIAAAHLEILQYFDRMRFGLRSFSTLVVFQNLMMRQVWEVRMQRVLQDFKRDNEAVTTAAWHPKHEEVFASGSQDGSIVHWLVSQPTTQVHPSLICDQWNCSSKSEPS